MRLSDLVIANLRDVLYLNPILPFRHIAARIGFSELHLNISNWGKVHLRTRGSDAIILRQIFRDRDYDFSPFPQSADIQAAYQEIIDRNLTPVVIDAGANMGASSLWFATAFPKAAILAVEPQPQNADLCRRNVTHLPNIRVFEAALGATSGCVSIVENETEAWAFQTERSSTGGIGVVTIPELVKSVPNGCLFGAKIDVEGFEADVFAQNTAWLDDLTFLFIEPHDWMLPGAGTSREFQRRLAKSDFELIIAGENLLYVAKN